MKKIYDFSFCKNAAAPMVSNPSGNSLGADTLVLSVTGTFTAASLKVSAKFDEIDGGFVGAFVMRTSDLKAFKNGVINITEAGEQNFTVGLMGVKSIKVEVVSVTGGNISVYGAGYSEG